MYWDVCQNQYSLQKWLYSFSIFKESNILSSDGLKTVQKQGITNKKTQFINLRSHLNINLGSIQYYKMMLTKIKLFGDRVIAGFTSFSLAVFATLDSSPPAATYHSCGHIYHMYKDQEGLQAWR